MRRHQLQKTNAANGKRADDHDRRKQQITPIRTGETAPVDVTIAERENEQGDLPDDGKDEQQRVAHIRPRRQGPELFRAIVRCV